MYQLTLSSLGFEAGAKTSTRAGGILRETVSLAMRCKVTLASCAVPRRAVAALALLGLGVLSLLNQAPTDPYFMLKLQSWEQGRFIRFHGLAHCVGWLWPYAAVVHLLNFIWQGRESWQLVASAREVERAKVKPSGVPGSG